MLGIKWVEREAAVSDLKPFERNPRKISPEAYASLVASLKQDGYHQRILATQDHRIVGGHQRIKALKELGVESVKILVPEGDLTDEQFRRILVRDNLPFGEFDLDFLLTDYSNQELVDWGMPSDWLKDDKKIDIPELAEQIPDIASVAVTQRGDTWILGQHRLRCGDSTNAQDVAALLAGAVPHLMVTDPPYGVKYNPRWRNEAGINKNTKKSGEVLNDDKADWREAWALFPGNIAYVWHAGLFAGVVAESLEVCGFALRSQIIWVKDRFALSRGDYHWHHEPCWYAVKGTGNWQGDRKQHTVWEIKAREDAGLGHGTQKPVECMKRPIENNSVEGDGVYEPFSGSGTTIIAAQLTNRVCYAMELSPLYVDMAVRRWEQFTGQQAILEASGETFFEKASQ